MACFRVLNYSSNRKMKRSLWSAGWIVFLTVLCTGAFAQDSLSTESEIVIAPDDPFAERLDAQLQSLLHQSNFLNSDSSCLNIYGYAADEIPEFSEEVFRERVHQLDLQTPMELRYDDNIQAFINLYVNKRRELSSRVLGLSELYFPMIEEMLDRFDIPLEMKYLAIVESALNPTARSRAGAKGLWQFMYATGKMYDLKVSSYEDDRFDPYASTVAACRYLKFLHGIYGDWNMVLAAYNSGPGNVNKAIRRSGGKKDYWSVRPFLPRETRGYVPAFIAVNYMMAYHKEHNLYPLSPGCAYYETDTVHIRERVNFDQIAAYTGVSPELLSSLNPMYIKQVIPARSESPRVLRLPAETVGIFIANEDSIFNHYPKGEAAAMVAEEVTEYHRVRSGEFLGSIANRYGVRVQQLMEWNGLRNTNIYPGQNLVVYRTVSSNREVVQTDDKKPSVTEQAAVSKPAPTESTGEYRYHIVQRGDTLWDIAKKYEGVTVTQLKQLNNELNFNRLKPGQKIKIGYAG